MSANKQIKSDVVEPKDEGDFAVLQLTYDESDAFWRRVVVPKNRNLDFLHAVIQAAFGWMNYHSYDFTKGRQSYVPDGVLAVDDEVKEKKTKSEKKSKNNKKMLNLKVLLKKSQKKNLEKRNYLRLSVI